jgi:hypothetical protein
MNALKNLIFFPLNDDDIKLIESRKNETTIFPSLVEYLNSKDLTNRSITSRRLRVQEKIKSRMK